MPLRSEGGMMGYIAIVALIIAGFMWLVVLPTVGLLFMIGALS